MEISARPATLECAFAVKISLFGTETITQNDQDAIIAPAQTAHFMLQSLPTG